VRETVDEIRRIQNVSALQKFMASHEPKKYSRMIIHALNLKYNQLHKNTIPTGRSQALIASSRAQYANFHPVWDKKKPAARPRRR